MKRFYIFSILSTQIFFLSSMQREELSSSKQSSVKESFVFFLIRTCIPDLKETFITGSQEEETMAQQSSTTVKMKQD